MEADGHFRSANPQFCKLLDVTPAELIGRRYQDITPPGIREVDERNAQLVRDGLIDFYLLRKKYQFSDDRQVKVVLLVTPVREAGKFLFFLARIMLDDNGALSKGPPGLQSDLAPSFRRWMSSAGDFLIKYGKLLLAIGTIIGGAVVAVLN